MARHLLTGGLMILALTGLPLTAWAQVETLRHELVSIQFQDGGRAAGYIVFRDSANFAPPVDWAVVVTGGDEETFPPFVYDPTNSRALFSGAFVEQLYLEALDAPCLGWLRKLSFRNDRREISCGAPRDIVAGDLQPVIAPVIALKVNGLHPASREVHTAGHVAVTFEMLRGGWTTELNWYWAVVVNGAVRWVGPTGLSTTPQRLARITPYETGLLSLIDQTFAPGTVMTNWFLAMDGSSIVAYDVITAVVDGS